jgi:glycosyltransferase involved in cell wall biosynthesis
VDRLGQRLAGLVERAVGGVQSHSDAVAQHLTGRGHLVVIVTPFDTGWAAPLFAAAVGKVLRRLSRAQAERWRRLWHRKLLAGSLAAQRGTLDSSPWPVVYYPQCTLTAEVANGQRGRGEAVIVMVVHNAGSEANDLWWAGVCGLGDRLFRQVDAHHRRVVAELDAVVPVSQMSRQGFLLHCPDARALRERVIYNFLPDDWAVPVTGESGGRLDLITVGRLAPMKNHVYLLEVLAAANRLGHRYHLTIVGDGPESEHLRTRWRELGLEEQVAFLGARSDIAQLLAEHRAYIHAGIMETFGIVLIEAMAQGLPVLAAPYGAVPEVVRDGVEGRHFPLHSAEQAARILVAFMEDPEAMSVCGHAGRRRFEREFTASIAGARLEAFFHEVVAARKAAPAAGT